MTDRELDACLRSVRVPESAPDYWEWFPRRVMARVRVADGPRAAQRRWRRRWPRWAWVGALLFSSTLLVLCWESPRPCPLRSAVASVEQFVRFPSDLAHLPESVRVLMRVDRGLGWLVEEQP